VWCYNVPATSLTEQIPCDDAHKDHDGNMVDNFGWSRNLMLVHACHFVNGDARSCIQAIAKFYQPIGAEKSYASM
jgi:nucleoside 2-deoxyribosyltransferase